MQQTCQFAMQNQPFKTKQNEKKKLPSDGNSTDEHIISSLEQTIT
jgi:hypothetical protein